MKVEEVLIDLGDQPLRKSPYSRILHAVLNAYLPGEKPVNLEMDGQELLSLIYQLPDTALQERILEKQVGGVRNSDSYRTSVLIFSGFIGFIAVTVAITEILNADSAVSSGGMQILSQIVTGSFELLKQIL
jgi:uncharacterized membrane protein YkgB